MPNRLELVEDEISRKLAEARASGELQLAKDYGKPLSQPAGWDETPAEFRLGFQTLKDAGFYPPEVELMRKRSELRLALEVATDPSARTRLMSELAALEQRLAVRLESLAVNRVL